jgi:hypothetical protein
MLPPRLFGTRDFGAANATALLMMASLSAAVFLIAQYCQLVLGYSPLSTGLRILPSTATPLLVAGTGIAMALPTAATAAISAVRPDQLGQASRANSTLQCLGGVFGVALATTVFTASGRLGTAATFTAGFRPALAIAAGLSLLGALTALTLRRAPRRLEETAYEPVPVAVLHPA